MAIRGDILVDWSVSPRIIEVAAPSVLLKCQDLHDTLRSLASQMEAMDEDEIVDSSGKEALGAGLAVGLTIKLLNAKVRFQARPGPDVVQCIVYDGTLVTADGSTPIAPSAYTSITVMNQVGGVISTASGDVEAIATGVWNRPETEIGGLGTIGKKVKENLDDTVSSRAMTGDPMALTTEAYETIANTLFDLADSIEDGFTFRQSIRLMASMLCGKTSGGPGNSVFRDLADKKDRIVSVADKQGNRTVMGFDKT